MPDRSSGQTTPSNEAPSRSKGGAHGPSPRGVDVESPEDSPRTKRTPRSRNAMDVSTEIRSTSTSEGIQLEPSCSRIVPHPAADPLRGHPPSHEARSDDSAAFLQVDLVPKDFIPVDSDLTGACKGTQSLMSSPYLSCSYQTGSCLDFPSADPANEKSPVW